MNRIVALLGNNFASKSCLVAKYQDGKFLCWRSRFYVLYTVRVFNIEIQFHFNKKLKYASEVVVGCIEIELRNEGKFKGFRVFKHFF